MAKIPVVSKNAEYAANDWKYISVAIFLGLGIYLIIKAARGKEIEERKAERFYPHRNHLLGDFFVWIGK